ncbi:PorV/PorQ family protein [Chitinophagales bacterium]|nr:PorV/PorQ family protein [Chitinophagales bacterium]
MMLKKISLLLLSSFLLMALSAQKSRKYSNEFLNIGMGASGMAMSNSRVAGTGDLFSMYYNAAGLAHIKDNFQIGYMHSEYFAGIAKIDYLAVAIPLENEKRSLGLTFYRFGIDDIPNTLFLFPNGTDNPPDYSRISRFTNGEYAVLLSYGQKLKPEGLSVGGSVKIIHKKVGSFATAWGVGIDAGLQYRKNGWRFGINARDVSSTYNAWSFNFTAEEADVLQATGNLVPENSLELTLPMILLGVGHQFNIKNKFYIEPELNVNMNTDGRRNVLFRTDPVGFDATFGLELNYKNIIYLRSGVGNFQWITKLEGNDKLTAQPNIGVGLNIKGFHIDYAFTNLGDQTSVNGQDQVFYSNVISAHFGFPKKNKQEDNIQEL